MKNRGELNKTRGSFTLIELLIVISIIAIVSAFIFVGVRSSQSRARDTQRVTDLGILNSAIQTYYRETGHFPQLPEGCGREHPDYGWIDGAITSDVD
jgi:prepilin-type N-terminal cleavage/methylation domain-containing protein